MVHNSILASLSHHMSARHYTSVYRAFMQKVVLKIMIILCLGLKIKSFGSKWFLTDNGYDNTQQLLLTKVLQRSCYNEVQRWGLMGKPYVMQEAWLFASWAGFKAWFLILALVTIRLLYKILGQYSGWYFPTNELISFLLPHFYYNTTE